MKNNKQKKKWAKHSYPLANEERCGTPCVWVKYISKGHRKYGKLQIDTGATCNHLVRKHLDSLTVDPLEDNGIKVQSSCAVVKQWNTRMRFEIGNIVYHESFGVLEEENDIPAEDNEIIGTLGVFFLMKHRLILDFERGVLRFNKSLQPRRPRGCDFVFDIYWALNMTRQPLIDCFVNGKSFSCLVDSGGLNFISYDMLMRSGFPCENREEKRHVWGVGYNTDTDTWRLKINFCTYIDTHTDFSVVSITDDFNVLPAANKFEKQEKDILTIGHDLLWEDGWIIDVWAGTIYRRKVCQYRKQNLLFEHE